MFRRFNRRPTRWDAGARALLTAALVSAGVKPAVVARPELIDARLLEAPGGYVLPVANYHDRVGQEVTLEVRARRKVVKAVSAYHGPLRVQYENGRVKLTLPALGYGDVLRLEVGK